MIGCILLKLAEGIPSYTIERHGHTIYPSDTLWLSLDALHMDKKVMFTLPNTCIL